MNPNLKKSIGLLLVLFVCMLSISTPFQNFASFPQEIRMFSGQDKQLSLTIPANAQISVNNPQIVTINGSAERSLNVDLQKPISLQTNQIGQTEMQLKLFGKIPLKKLKVDVVPNLRVIPGGQTIGVKVKSSGILVVGYHLLQVEENKKVSPGEEAQIQLGDLIVEMNGTPVKDVSKVSAFVDKAAKDNKPLKLTILRNDKKMSIDIKPTYDIVAKSHRLGLYIRDSAAGVGTLTFYAPDHGVYGALGHMITDMDTQTPIKVGGGEIVHSKVTSISKSHHGAPGEKRAHFYKESKVLGNIENNTQFGIFGKMKDVPSYGHSNEAIPVAFSEEIEEGKAHILTVVEGQKVEKFDIEVVHVSNQDTAATKGMVIKITDPRLIESTGGIVQGMSGSPIIQKGKMIGAVTHVFVNDPTSGYGCFIEWMLQDAGIMVDSSKTSSDVA